MTRGKTNLEWTNIARADVQGDVEAEAAFVRFAEAKLALEAELSRVAVEQGAASEGDSFKFSYARIGQGTVGMAIDAQKAPAQASGFGGLKAPKPRENLADWARDRDMRGYRR